MTETIIFDERCACWTTDPTFNEAFLSMQERYFNGALTHYGYRYSNQFYEAYGVPWDPIEQTNNCYLVQNGELTFDYELFDNGTVIITIRQ